MKKLRFVADKSCTKSLQASAVGADSRADIASVRGTQTTAVANMGMAIFRGMNIHLPAILMFTRGTRF